MKDLANEYTYKKIHSWDEDTRKCSYEYTKLKVWRNNRLYQTKKDVFDLPEHYCDVWRYGENHDVINSKGVKDLYYTWVRENHFMKDSVLRISYTGKIITKPATFTDSKGNVHEFCFKDYENVDVMVFGYEIFKFLAYAKKYSDFDISGVKDEFVKHCEWLKVNEPEYAPDTDDFATWFDTKISEI